MRILTEEDIKRIMELRDSVRIIDLAKMYEIPAWKLSKIISKEIELQLFEYRKKLYDN